MFDKHLSVITNDIGMQYRISVFINQREEDERVFLIFHNQNDAITFHLRDL
jgi:hypothetical protein